MASDNRREKLEPSCTRPTRLVARTRPLCHGKPIEPNPAVHRTAAPTGDGSYRPLNGREEADLADVARPVRHRRRHAQSGQGADPAELFVAAARQEPRSRTSNVANQLPSPARAAASPIPSGNGRIARHRPESCRLAVGGEANFSLGRTDCVGLAWARQPPASRTIRAFKRACGCFSTGPWTTAASTTAIAASSAR